MKKKNLKLRILFNVVSLTIGIYILINYIIAKNYIIPDRYPAANYPPNFIETNIKTDSCKLPIWITKGLCTEKPKKLVYILIHGYKGNRDHWTPVLTDLSTDAEVVTVALRAHDTNNAAHTTFATKEADDVSSVVDWVASHYLHDNPTIILLGSSLGGVTSWITSSKNKHVDGIISDSAFLTLTLSSDRWLERTFTGASTILKPMVVIAKTLINVDTDKISPIEAAANWKGKPSMVIHCENDNIVSYDESNKIAQAAGAKLHIMKDANHAKSQITHHDTYVKLVKDFGNQVLKSKNR